MGRNIMLTDIL